MFSTVSRVGTLSGSPRSEPRLRRGATEPARPRTRRDRQRSARCRVKGFVAGSSASRAARLGGPGPALRPGMKERGITEQTGRRRGQLPRNPSAARSTLASAPCKPDDVKRCRDRPPEFPPRPSAESQQANGYGCTHDRREFHAEPHLTDGARQGVVNLLVLCIKAMYLPGARLQRPAGVC